MLYLVCTMHEEMRSMNFLVEPQNQDPRFISGLASKSGRVSWFGLKTKVYGLSVVSPQNHWDGFSRSGIKTGGDGFS
jgi:hypothetical protein